MSNSFINSNIYYSASRWLFSTNHKDIGVLYIIFGAFAAILGTPMLGTIITFTFIVYIYMSSINFGSGKNFKYQYINFVKINFKISMLFFIFISYFILINLLDCNNLFITYCDTPDNKIATSDGWLLFLIPIGIIVGLQCGVISIVLGSNISENSLNSQTETLSNVAGLVDKSTNIDSIVPVVNSQTQTLSNVVELVDKSINTDSIISVINSLSKENLTSILDRFDASVLLQYIHDQHFFFVHNEIEKLLIQQETSLALDKLIFCLNKTASLANPAAQQELLNNQTSTFLSVFDPTKVADDIIFDAFQYMLKVYTEHPYILVRQDFFLSIMQKLALQCGVYTDKAIEISNAAGIIIN